MCRLFFCRQGSLAVCWSEKDQRVSKASITVFKKAHETSI